MNYRAEIDGMRALAVIPVILFHAGFDLFSGGYVGVDVFFVISGYLITTIILNEMQEGDFSLANFYERRARRILPALFFVMICAIPFAWLWMLPDPMENFGQSVVATTLFSNNILLFLTSGYWDLASEFKPLLHTWSLAVEEQYYLLFPLFLMLVWRLGTPSIITLVCFLLLVSIGSAHWAAFNAPVAAFFLLPTRGWELLLGVICAFYLLKMSQRPSLCIRNAAAAAGLLLIVFAVFVFDEATPTPSLYTLAPTVGTALLILFADEKTFVKKLMSAPLLVGIGLISYSAYLWHQPILAFAKIYSKEEVGQFTNAFLVVLTFFIAALAWHFVEKPFRNRKIVGRRSFVISMALTATVLVAFGYGAHSSHGYPERIYDESVASSDTLYISYNRSAFDHRKDAFETEHMKVLVIGNSFGRDLVNMVKEVYDLSQVEILYRDDLTGCSLLTKNSEVESFWQADVILFGSYQIESTCAEQLFVEARKNSTVLYFFGTKQFGSNLNWIARIPHKDRTLLQNRVDESALEFDRSASDALPPGSFISIIEPVSNERGIYVTDEAGRLISGDRTHLTQFGARFVGKAVLLPSAVSNHLTPRQE